MNMNLFDKSYFLLKNRYTCTYIRTYFFNMLAKSFFIKIKIILKKYDIVKYLILKYIFYFLVLY